LIFSSREVDEQGDKSLLCQPSFISIAFMSNAPETDLNQIALASIDKEEENEEFRIFLQTIDPAALDEAVHRLNESVSAQIDCTKCGNCCRSLMINVEKNEVARAAARSGLNEPDFIQHRLEQSLGGQYIINRQPCYFLDGNHCTIYEDRFQSCRDFPHLHQPGVSRRLFSIFMHYGRCPIVYNTVELLKVEFG